MREKARYFPGFEGFSENPLATGLWATALFWIAVYSGLCVYHNRSPLWPTRRLRFRSWAFALVKTTGVATYFFNLVACGIILSNYAPNCHGFILFSIGVQCLLTFWWLVPSGVVSHMFGLNHRNANRDKEDGYEDEAEKRSTSESWDENLEGGPSSSAVVSDIEASKPHAAKAQDVTVPFSRSKIYLACVVTNLALVGVLLHVSIARVCAQIDPTIWNATGWHIAAVMIIMACTLLVTGGRYALEFYAHKGSLGGWDMFWRALAFFTFNFTFLTATVAQALLEEGASNVYKGIPVFPDPISVRGYAFFAGYVVAFLLPLFSF